MQDTDPRFWLSAKRSLTRRQLLRGGAVGGLGLAAAALIGCGDDDDEAPAATAAPAAATAAPAATTAAAAATAAATPEVMQPKRGGTLRIAGQLAGDVPSLDYHRTNGSAMGSIANNVGAKLVQWDERPDSDAPAEAVLPDLATSWEQTPDGLNWTFNLRDDAQTSDGRVVLAEDVVWSFRRASFMRDPAGLLPRFTAEMFTDREPNAEAVDDYTVKTTLTAPDADYLSIMGSHWWTVETKEAITRNGTELGDKGFGDIVSVEQMRGAGPFYPTEYVPASGFKLARNPNYYAPDLPYVDELDHPLILDPTAAAAALQAGELDAFGPLISFPINQAFEMEKVDSLNVDWFPAMVWNPWVFDLTVAPFNDVRVRRALALAIDRPTWIKELYSGRGRNAVMVLPWLSFWYLPPEEMGDAGRYYTGWDPDEAKKLLMAAGAEGASYTVQAANIGSYTITYPNIDLVASMVAEVGLEQKLNIVDYAAHIGGQTFPDGGIYQSWIVRPDIQSFVYSSVHHERARSGGKYVYQASYDNEPEYREAAAIMEKQRVILDSEERRELVHDLQRRWAQGVWNWYWPLQDSPIVSNKSVHGFSPTPGWNAGVWKYVWKE